MGTKKPGFARGAKVNENNNGGPLIFRWQNKRAARCGPECCGEMLLTTVGDVTRHAVDACIGRRAALAKVAFQVAQIVGNQFFPFFHQTISLLGTHFGEPVQAIRCCASQ